jgi:hypothetical protein
MVRFVNAHSEVALPERGASAMRRGGQQGAWRAATTSEPMLDGVHFAEFTIERKNFGLFFGAVRPGWDVERCDVTGAHSVAAATLYGHCLYYSLSGKRWPDNGAWEGMQPAREGDRIGLLLDLDQGSLTVYKNDQWLGVMAGAGLKGEYCWAVSLGADKDCVHIESKPAPERTQEQLAAAEAAALAHAAAAAEREDLAAAMAARVQREVAVLDQKKKQEVVTVKSLLTRGRSRDEARRAADAVVAQANEEADVAARKEAGRQSVYYTESKKIEKAMLEEAASED